MLNNKNENIVYLLNVKVKIKMTEKIKDQDIVILTTGCFLCKRGKKCKKVGCNFAHSIEELNPTKCKWNMECIRRKCTYQHEYESKEEYAVRVFYSDLERLGIELNVLPKRHNPFAYVFPENYEGLPFDMEEFNFKSWAEINEEEEEYCKKKYPGVRIC
jgi:hypothetical protein